MRVRLTSARRRGNILPLLALTVTLLFAFVALAIDVGVLTIARTEAQSACDAGALAGTRVLNNRQGHVENDKSAATTVAQNTVLQNINVYVQQNRKYTVADNMTFPSGDAITVGQYNYNTTSQRFEPSFPSSNGGLSWTAMRVRLRGDNPTFFAKIVGVNSMPWETFAVAAHRPRDIALVLDFSASMQFGSQFSWNAGWSNANGPVYGMFNPDPVYPRAGHYWRYTQYSTTVVPSTSAATGGTPGTRPNPFSTTSSIGVGGDGAYAPANYTVETPGGPPIVFDFRFDPANLSNPATPVTIPNAGNMWNAFNRWMRATPSVENVFLDSGFRPTVTSATNLGAYVNRTFNWSGYNAFDTTNQFGPTPAPDFFRDQADDASSGVNYVGDRFARKGGQIFTTATTWNPTTTTGAARDVRDLLSVAGTGAGNLTPTARTTSPVVVPSGYAFPTFGDGGTSWNNFRDDLWERYGYDLDLARYSGTSPSGTNRTNAPLRTTNLFQGFSMGPAYYGKTFFQWPPDPRWGATGGGFNGSGVQPDRVHPTQFAQDQNSNWIADWRRRFFLRSDGTQFDPQADNDTVTAGTQSINQVLLNNGTGRVLNTTTSRYRVNYPAVLAWIKTGPQVLPPNLRAGRILYYSSIPNDCNDTTNLDQRFWRDYIDFVLGYTGNDTGLDPQYALAGNEPFGFPEGTTPAVQATAAFTPTGAPSANRLPYMNYTDNPSRPKLHFWFGPLSMVAFLNARSGSAGRNMWLAGTVHEAQCWQLKAAMNSALDDIKNNHPNDFCGLVYFASYNFQTPRVTMGQDFVSLKNALFYPHSLLAAIKNGDTTTELRPYNSNMGNALVGNIPNANGGTDPVSGFAMAFNTLSWSDAAHSARSPNGAVNGGTGRRGAAKIVVYETDGVPNSRPAWTYTGSGWDTYFREGGSNPGSDAASDSIAVVNRMRQMAGSGGFSLPSAPCRVFAIGFGDLFSVSPEPSGATSAKAYLLNVQKAGGTSSATDTALPAGHIIAGPYQTRIDNLKDTLERIMQSGVQVTLIQ